MSTITIPIIPSVLVVKTIYPNKTTNDGKSFYKTVVFVGVDSKFEFVSHIREDRFVNIFKNIQIGDIYTNLQSDSTSNRFNTIDPNSIKSPIGNTRRYKLIRQDTKLGVSVFVNKQLAETIVVNQIQGSKKLITYIRLDECDMFILTSSELLIKFSIFCN